MEIERSQCVVRTAAYCEMDEHNISVDSFAFHPSVTVTGKMYERSMDTLTTHLYFQTRGMKDKDSVVVEHVLSGRMIERAISFEPLKTDMDPRNHLYYYVVVYYNLYRKTFTMEVTVPSSNPHIAFTNLIKVAEQFVVNVELSKHYIFEYRFPQTPTNLDDLLNKFGDVIGEHEYVFHISEFEIAPVKRKCVFGDERKMKK